MKPLLFLKGGLWYCRRAKRYALYRLFEDDIVGCAQDPYDAWANWESADRTKDTLLSRARLMWRKPEKWGTAL